MSTLDRGHDLPGRKRKLAIFRIVSRPPEKDETEVRWLMSYSDFMMQLVCLFILLYSVSSIDTSKAVPLAQAWRDEVGVSEVRVPSAPKGSYLPLTSADLPSVMHEIHVLAGRHPGGNALRVSRTARGFRLQFVYEMFDRGSDRLSRQGMQVADLAAILLEPLQRRAAAIELVGHGSADEPDALGLSLGRAQEAFRRITRSDAPYKLQASAIRVAGRGAHEPAADNAESSGRAINRRVEFVVTVAPAP
jgi:chemotaxis protein MotB